MVFAFLVKSVFFVRYPIRIRIGTTRYSHFPKTKMIAASFRGRYAPGIQLLTSREAIVTSTELVSNRMHCYPGLEFLNILIATEFPARLFSCNSIEDFLFEWDRQKGSVGMEN